MERTRTKELGRQRPPVPCMGLARPHTTAGAQTAVPLPTSPHLTSPAKGMAWGVELGVVLSHHAHHVPAATTLRHVAGYLVVTRLRAADSQAGRAESASALLLDPTLVTPDHLPQEDEY
ncbi:fumarylacetoacetate hydrolase family protein [Streptomyces sp. NPDC002463]|uniref:fumarylacetoacetate hydrolase family protein n=1 Tax=Streptomyces sp. NPDC002463 TaxID=3364645 RepID=UPI00367F186B